MSSNYDFVIRSLGLFETTLQKNVMSESIFESVLSEMKELQLKDKIPFFNDLFDITPDSVHIYMLTNNIVVGHCDFSVTNIDEVLRNVDDVRMDQNILSFVDRTTPSCVIGDVGIRQSFQGKGLCNTLMNKTFEYIKNILRIPVINLDNEGGKKGELCYTYAATHNGYDKIFTSHLTKVVGTPMIFINTSLQAIRTNKYNILPSNFLLNIPNNSKCSEYKHCEIDKLIAENNSASIYSIKGNMSKLIEIISLENIGDPQTHFQNEINWRLSTSTYDISPNIKDAHGTTLGTIIECNIFISGTYTKKQIGIIIMDTFSGILDKTTQITQKVLDNLYSNIFKYVSPSDDRIFNFDFNPSHIAFNKDESGNILKLMVLFYDSLPPHGYLLQYKPESEKEINESTAFLGTRLDDYVKKSGGYYTKYIEHKVRYEQLKHISLE